MKNSYITATDQFCGAGGSTTGAKNAGVEVKMALNHWKLAIETHNSNHPTTDHDCTDVQACDPRRYPSTDILITSPECTNHSLAKGKKRTQQGQIGLFESNKPLPEEERSRATMWDVVRFSEYHNYNIILVENVVDARYWALFEAWIKAMHDLGYNHKCCYLNSMFFHPCPQSRDRMYVVFWKKGNREPDLDYKPTAHCDKCSKDVEAFQSWKNPQKKSGKFNTQYLYRCSSCNKEVMPYYYCAFNIIDWSIPAQRIGDRKKELSPKTVKRIQYGIEKYWNQPLYVNTSFDKEPKPLIEVLPTVTTQRSAGLFYPPLIVTTRYSSGVDCRVRNAVNSVMPTQPGDASHNWIFPFIISTEHSKVPIANRCKSTADAIWTQTTTQSNGIAFPSEMHNHLLMGNYTPGWSRLLTRTCGTVTTDDHHALLSMPPIIDTNYGISQPDSSFSPIKTITTGGINHAVLYAENKKIDINDCFYRMIKAGEIQSAMAFPNEYIVLGNERQKVRQLGNAVTPPVMEWLVRQCVASLEKI